MNHKLRVFVRMDIDPAHVTLEITGCVAPSDSATLMHIVRRAGRIGAGAEVIVDLHGTSHLDPDVLLDLRRLAADSPLPSPESPDAGEPGTAVPFRLTLEEPAELPICLLHVGAEAEVLAELDTEVLAGLDTGPDSGLNTGLDTGLDSGLDSGLGAANSPLAAEAGSVSDLGAMDGLALSEYFEDTLDPAATVRALSDTALCRLADALYRHLDTPRPSYGAHTWYELAAEELQNRHLADGDGSAEDELAPDTALA
ncbi:hypothetical protein SAMN04487916_10544 [Arthrobacter sp. ov407]|uniref:hypothetical protein n=1 Tax=Arthrobacter sp. ov407 TaxID=1761748 RepID=UPI00088FDF48|nr:hypothetical protein [Arthrobacter sp. ov407]SDL01761.1 hypothetical protein SAMN04487916_10544 [Arthrobacter sp. ov407]